jgi:DNA invertase Pin-like site-specific DNA recombinase
MALAFFGNRPHKHVVRHLNGDPLDNRIENLSYGTYKDNSQDTITHNRAIRGSKQHNAKLDEEKVRQIRCLAKSGHSQLEISNLFNIDRRIINDILKARSWGWLDDYKHGPLIEAKSAKWGRSCNARYSEDDIRSIKKLKDLGKTHKEIAAIYNCHFNTISLILRGKSLTAKRVLNENGKKKT